jgi:hypothetical protein
MPEPISNGAVDATPENTGRSSAFSPDYVKELREEAASWRTKFREAETKAITLEQSIHQMTTGAKVKEEIAKRGLKINPDFIKLDKDGDATKAIDAFLEEYPQFAAESTQVPSQTQPRRGVKPVTVEKPHSMSQPLSSNKIMDAKNDPMARAKLRDQYRLALGRKI